MRDYNNRKRQIPVWEDDIPNKRFSGPFRSKSRPFVRPTIPPLMSSGLTYGGGYQGSLSRQPNRPFSGPFKPKPQKKDAFPPKRNANPPKKAATPQTKDPNTPKATKSTSAPNKPNAHPAAERKRVAEADVTSESSAQETDNRLCSDREPSKQVIGRLELALGSIIKEIKAADPSVVRSTAVIRDIKAAVRERIRELMMNQVVGPADAVKTRYREVYDAQSDLEIVTNVLDAQSGKVTLLKIGNVEIGNSAIY